MTNDQPRRRHTQQSEQGHKVIAVDFDGVLCSERWPQIGAPNYAILDTLISRRAQGDRLILWTCREGKLLDEAVAWCEKQGLTFDAVNANIDERIEQYGNDPRKISADEYWDDRAIAILAQDRVAIAATSRETQLLISYSTTCAERNALPE